MYKTITWHTAAFWLFRIVPRVAILLLEIKKPQSGYALRLGVLLVEMMGIEPTTSTLRTLRSPN